MLNTHERQVHCMCPINLYLSHQQEVTVELHLWHSETFSYSVLAILRFVIITNAGSSLL